MKSQFKRFSKSTLSVVLAICMLVSCMTVGLIATDAAQTAEERVGAIDNSEAVGWTKAKCYIHGSFGDGWKDYSMNDNGDVFVTVSATSQSFKLVAEDTWYGNKGWGGNGVTVGSQCTAHQENGDSGSDLTASLSAGTYKFHYNSRSNDNKALYYTPSAVTTYPANTKFYLDTSDYTNWENDSARFAVFFCNSGKAGENGAWVSATPCPGSDHHYYVTSPADSYYTTMIWCRMNGSNQTNNWDNKYNQTGDLSYESGKYTTKITDWNAGTQNNTTHTHTITITGKGRDYVGATISNLTSANSSGTPDWTSEATYNPANYKVATAPSGYTYTGIYTNAGCTTAAGTSISNTGDATYYALYTHNKINVNFKNTSGTGGTVSQGGTQKISSLTTSNQAISTDYNRSLSYTITPASGKKITAVSGGGTWSIASGGTSATCTFTATGATNVTVTQEDAGTCGFTLNKSSATLDIGGTTTFTATPNSYHVSGTITAVSSDTNVATVSKSGNTYTVTAISHGTATITVSCTEGGSATFSVTVSTPTISISLGKTTLNIGETTTITSTVTNQGSATITYTSSNTSVATISGTTITAKAPGTTKIKATVDGINSSEITLTVNTPEFTLSYSPSTIYTGGITATPTVTIKSGTANASSTKSSITYSITNGGSSATINSSTGVVTSTSTAGSVTVQVSGTVTYNSISYTTAIGTATVTVATPHSIYFDVATVASNWSNDQNKGGYMTYDQAATNIKGGTAEIYKLEAALASNTIYYLRTWDGSVNYKPSSEITSAKPLSGDGVSGVNGNGSTTAITTTNSGTYTFYYDYVNHTFYVEYPALVCSYNVNAKYAKDSAGTDYSNDLSGVTVTPSSGSWTSGNSAISLSATTVSGYTFAQWAVTSGEGTITNATSRTGATFTPSSENATVTAQYKKEYTVSYNANPNNGSVSVNPTSGLVAGDTFIATFSPSSGYILDIVSVSNDENVSISGNSYTGTASGDNTIITVTASFAKTTWTVAGDSIALFGTEWDTRNASNNMASSDNINYSKEYSNVALSAGTIKFKVVRNHSWDNAYPSSDYELSIPQNGNYNITITYKDDSTHTVTATAELIKEYYLLGFGTGSDYWGTSSNREVSARKMTYNSSTGKYTFTYSLVQQTYPYSNNDGFKVYCNDGTWFSHNGNGDNMTRANPGPWTMSTATGKGNIGIIADVAGEYIFEFDPTAPNIKVYYPNTVSFDTHGGSTVNSQVVTYGGHANRPSSDPTRTGYTFTNWYTAQTGGSVFNFVNTAITQDTTVHAQWSQNSYSITYNEDNAKYTIGGSKPGSAHYNDTISFTVTPQANYRIESVKYTPSGGSPTDCTAGDNNEFHFTMPDKNVTVTINMVETRTVTLTAGTGFATKQYKIGNGSYSDYSAPFTVDKGSVVTFKVTYSNGYEFDSVTNATASSNNTIFTTAAINSNTTVTITAKKSTYDLNGAVSPTQGGAVTFYSTYANAVAGTNAITTAQIDNNVFAKYTPDSDRYTLSSFSKSGDGLSSLTVQADSNIVKFTMGYSDATITANVVATTPTFSGTWSGMIVYANENFTYNNTGGGTVSPTGCTYTYSFNSSAYQASSAFTAPDRPGTYTLIIKASNKPAGISTAATATKSVNIEVRYHEATVKYYIDMHNNNMQDKTLDVAIVSNGSGSDESILKDSEDHNCIGNLLQQGDSTVYAASIATPATKVTNSDSYQPINLRIRYGSNGNWVTKIVAIDSSYATPLMNAASPEVWLEANNEAANTYKVTYANNSTTAVQSGKKRLYVAKPLNWETAETSWTHLHLYHWGDYADIGWNSAPLMTHIGSDSNYHYYYIDVDSGIDNIIFQGWKNNSTSPDVQTENIEKIGSSNFFVLSKDNGKYYGTKSDENETVPGYTRYVSSVDMNVGETANIAPVNTGKKVIYSSNNNNVTVSEDGDVTATGSALATITVKVYGSVGARVTSANPGDVMTYECTVNVHNPGIFKGYRIISFDHQEYNVIIPTISGANPGYFNLDNASVVVNGLYDDATSTYITKYANSAIIEATDTIDVDGVGNDLPIEFTVKYAASNSNTGYSNITLDNATITTVSIKKSGQKRFGFKEWIPSQANITSSKTIDNGVETVVHKGLAFSSGTTTYQATFDEYKYVDVTFTFNYYEYNPELSEDGMVNYPYDETWAGSETFGNTFNKKMFTVTELADGTVKGSWAANGSAGASTPCVTLDVSAVSSSGGNWYAWTWGESDGRWITGNRNGNIITFADNDVDNNIIFVRMNAGDAMNWNNAQNKTADLSSRSHNLKTVTVSNYEVRNKTADTVEASDLVTPALSAIGVKPDNNYYSYSIAAANITISNTSSENYTASAAVNMAHSVKRYSVYLNGNLVGNNYTYQEYAEPKVDDPPTASSVYNWYAVDDRNATDTTNAPLLATGVNSYKFRVKGSANSTNTYLRTVTATNPHGNDFLRSEVDFSHYEVTHQGSSPTSMKEYLMQNFYIADFFSPAEVLDPNSYSGKGKFGPAYKVETVNESTSPSSGNITVYFTDTLNWNNIKIYYWGENIDVQWPGVDMTLSETDGDDKSVYSASIPENVKGIIFTGSEKQTVDITQDIANGSHWKSKNETAQNGIPYDDAQFVGGGVVYYSMNGATENNQGTPFANAVSSGYVNGSDGKINTNAVKEMLKANIEAQYAKDNIAGAVGENEAMKIAYGTEIAATKNKEGGFNTGIIYRYLPLNQYKRDGSGNLVTDGDGKYTLAYDVNKNTFRYSNSLQSYQYVYASGNENKATNAGKNMRLYSYYVYSYVTYDQETNVPVTKYEIVLSDNYSDASTYWEGNPNPDPSN